MARKSKEEAEKTRTRILASALALFSKKGYDRTTFTDIAARLKLTKGAVYWHFESKEALIVELVRLALEKFRRQLDRLMPEGELTFPAVAEMMVKNAEGVVNDAKGRSFFQLMHCEIKWCDESMAGVRDQLLKDCEVGPRAAIQRAVENDIRAGRIRKDVNPVAVSSAAIALWDGLVKARIDDFLECDLAVTLTNFYRGMWESMREVKSER